MKLRLPILFFVISLWLVSRLAFAGVEQISEKEFCTLAEELAPKVNLFAAGWEKDPKAEFYGGTTRDYLYWLKGQFIEARNRKEADAVIQKLRGLPLIDVRSFIIGDSDIDVISAGDHSLNAAEFGVRKIDFQKPDILDPSTELGQNEMLQGYIPAEKVRLGKSGFQPSRLGDGVNEIYTGKLSVKFSTPEDFAKSKYAKDGVNHPILLALRYIRVQAINYFRTHGKHYPDAKLLREGLDPESARQVKELVEKAARSGELKPYLEKKQFKSWINGAIQKSFRSYTNPTAALELMKEFGVVDLPASYPEQIEPVNQYVFSQFREPEKTAAALRAHQVDESKFFLPTKNFFPDSKLYHGTRTEEAFRGILFQGILPSDKGVALGGLYGVAEPDKAFSENWGGDKNRLLSFEVDPGAKIVNVTEGEGRRIWEATAGIHKGNYDKFAEHFGIDIIRYPYSPQAFVVKNASVLSAPRGVYRKVMPVNELIELAKRMKQPEEMMDLLSVNSLSSREAKLVIESSPIKVADFSRLVEQAGDSHPYLYELLKFPFVFENPDIQRAMGEVYAKSKEVQDAVARAWPLSPASYAWLDSLFKQAAILNDDQLSGALLLKMHDSTAPAPNAINFAIGYLADKEKSSRYPRSAIRALNTLSLDHKNLGRISELLSQPHIRENVDLEVADLLLKNKFNEEKTLKYLLSQLSLKRKLDNNDLEIADRLLQRGAYLPEVKKYLIKEALNTGTPARKADVLLRLTLHYAADKDVALLASEFAAKYLTEIIEEAGDQSLPSIGIINAFAKTWPENTALKQALLSRRNSSGFTVAVIAIQVLTKMNLTPEEMIQILRGNINRDAVNQFLSIYNHENGNHLHSNDPKLTRAFLDTSLDYLEPSFHNFHLNQILQKYGDPATIEAFFVEKFTGYKKKSIDPPMQKVLGMMASVHYEKPVGPAVAEAFLRFLEKNPKFQINDHPLLALPLEEEKVAMRVQNYMIRAKHHISAASLKLLERMPGISAEFREYVASAPEQNFLHKDLEAFKALKAQKLGCGPSFAKIAQ